eukprot:scaffold4563_cov242-Prasinococcus_capsulatus_cf.AAC.1
MSSSELGVSAAAIRAPPAQEAATAAALWDTKRAAHCTRTAASPADVSCLACPPSTRSATVGACSQSPPPPAATTHPLALTIRTTPRHFSPAAARSARASRTLRLRRPAM